MYTEEQLAMFQSYINAMHKAMKGDTLNEDEMEKIKDLVRGGAMFNQSYRNETYAYGAITSTTEEQLKFNFNNFIECYAKITACVINGYDINAELLV